MPTTALGQDRFGGNVHVAGRLTAGAFNPPADSIDDEAIKAEANIDPEKLGHQHQPTYAQGSAVAAADATQVLHVAVGDGTIDAFEAGNVVKAIGDDICTVDLLVNGVSVLDAPIELNSTAPAPYVLLDETIDTPAYEAGDVLEVVINATHNTGTLATGIFCRAVLRENANP